MAIPLLFLGGVIKNTEEVFLSKNLEKVYSEDIFHCILPFTLCKILLDLGTESLTSVQKYQVKDELKQTNVERVWFFSVKWLAL